MGGVKQRLTNPLFIAAVVGLAYQVLEKYGVATLGRGTSELTSRRTRLSEQAYIVRLKRRSKRKRAHLRGNA